MVLSASCLSRAHLSLRVRLTRSTTAEVAPPLGRGPGQTRSVVEALRRVRGLDVDNADLLGVFGEARRLLVGDAKSARVRVHEPHHDLVVGVEDDEQQMQVRFVDRRHESRREGGARERGPTA